MATSFSVFREIYCLELLSDVLLRHIPSVSQKGVLVLLVTTGLSCRGLES